MLATFRVPIADARGFSADAALAESVVLPSAWSERDFVRGIGLVSRRPARPVEPWAFEAAFADGHRTLLFEPGAIEQYTWRTDLTVQALRRRVWQALKDSKALIDFDLGIQLAPIDSHGQLYPRGMSYSLSALRREIGLLAALPMRVRSVPVAEPRRLITVGKPLAQRYADRTSPAGSSGLVGAGRITVVVEAPGIAMRDDLKVVHEHITVGRVNVTSFEVNVDGGGSLRCHVIWGSRSSRGDRRRIRELRIHILRLHSIFELMRFLNTAAVAGPTAGISDKRGTASFDRLQQTLLECARIVRTPNRPGNASSRGVLDTAFFAHRLVNGDLEVLLQRTLASARPKVRAEVAALLESERERAESDRHRAAWRAAVIARKTAGKVVMKNKFKIENVGVIGDDTIINGPLIVGSSNTINIGAEQFPSAELAAQLRELAAQINAHSTDSAETGRGDAAAAAAQLETAAGKADAGDSKGVLAALKKIGAWVVEITGQVAVPIAISAIKAATGIA